MSLQQLYITSAQYGQPSYDAKSAVVSFIVTRETNALPQDGTIIFNKAKFDAVLATAGLNIITSKIWVVIKFGSYYWMEGYISASSIEGRNYTCTLKDSVTALVKQTATTAWTTQTLINGSIVPTLMTAILGGSTIFGDTDETTIFQCNGQSVINCLRELAIINIGKGGSTRAFYNLGNQSSGISIEAFGSALANQAINFASAGIKLIAPAERQDTRHLIVNDVIVKYNGGQINVSDATSITNYGKSTKTYVKQELNNATDATGFGNGILALFKNPPVYVICQTKTMGEGGSGWVKLNGTYTVTDATSGISQGSLVAFKIVTKYPSYIQEVHLANVPINIVDETTDLGARVASIEANQPVGTNASPSFAGLNLVSGTFNGNLYPTNTNFLKTDGGLTVLGDFWCGGTLCPGQIQSQANDGYILFKDSRDSTSNLSGISNQWIDATHKLVHFHANYINSPVGTQLGMDFRMDTRGSGSFQWCIRPTGGSNTVIATMDSEGSLSLNSLAASGTVLGIRQATMTAQDSASALYLQNGHAIGTALNIQTNSQIALAGPGDLWKHVIASHHSGTIALNSIDFLLSNTVAGQYYIPNFLAMQLDGYGRVYAGGGHLTRIMGYRVTEFASSTLSATVWTTINTFTCGDNGLPSGPYSVSVDMHTDNGGTYWVEYQVLVNGVLVGSAQRISGAGAVTYATTTQSFTRAWAPGDTVAIQVRQQLPANHTLSIKNITLKMGVSFSSDHN